MSKLEKLLAEREALEKAIQEARQEGAQEAVATIRGLVAQFNLTPKDIFPTRGGKKAGGGKSTVAPKYRNPETGDTWTGRGKAPKWIQGQDRAQFAIDA
jgi:DNA-binding protein H-NS